MRLGKKTISAQLNDDGLHVWPRGEFPRTILKRPAFSPTQPWRAETRLDPGKVAVSEETEAYVWHGELLSKTTRQRADFFRVLQEESPSSQEATDWWSRKYAYDEFVIDDPGPIRPLLHAVRYCVAYLA